VSLKFGIHTVILEVQNVSNIAQINTTVPKLILPAGTAAPAAMTLDIGQIMAPLKQAGDCPNVWLTVKIGTSVVFDGYTYGKCTIQVTLKDGSSSTLSL
jgi:hypothetical protein